MSGYSHNSTQENYFIGPSLHSSTDLLELHSTSVRMVNLYICVVLISCDTEGILALVLSFFYTILKNVSF